MSFSFPLAPLGRRFLEALATLAGLVVLTFFLFKILPGSPFDDEVALHPAVRESLEKSWALDGPWTMQLSRYIGSVTRGDLGLSMTDQRPVTEILLDGLNASLTLNVCALLATFCFGLLGAMMMASRNAGLAWAVDTATVALVSLPSLFLGPLLIWIFAMRLDLLPVAFLDSPLHYVLPVLTLAMRPGAVLARLLATGLHEARRADYMRTAKAKGLNDRTALFAHALKNSLLPVIGYAGPLILGLLSGSFIVEVLFAVRGMGSAFVEAVAFRDLTVVLGLTLFYGVVLVTASLLLDVLARTVDPRLRDQE